MDLEGNGSVSSAFKQLGAVVALACASALVAVAAVFALASSHAVPGAEPCGVEVLHAGTRHCVRDEALCNACGTVERVRVITPRRPTHEVSTVAGGGTEGVAVLLGALSGRIAIAPVRFYEIEVRMKDGSVRAFQQGEAPIWQPGDRVRIRTGNVQPLT